MLYLFTILIVAQAGRISHDEFSIYDSSAILPNINQMQLGVFLPKLNAEEGNTNPGYTRKLFDLLYFEDDYCFDNDVLIPNALCTSYQKLISTNIVNTIDIASSYQDYLNALYKEDSFDKLLTIDGHYVNIENTSNVASLNYKLTCQFMEKEHSIVITSRAYVSCYHVELSNHLSDLGMIDLNDEFILDFNSLPAMYEKHESEYYDFLAYWGTHYQSKLTMGAKYAVKSMFTYSDYQIMNAEGIDVNSTAVRALWSKALSGPREDGGDEDDVREYNQRAHGEQAIIAYGPTPPPSSPNEWWIIANKNPASVFAFYSPISDFMTEDWIDDPDVTVKRINYMRAMKDICNFTQCYKPTNSQVKYSNRKNIATATNLRNY
jgi:hypothetical protein